MHVYNSNGVSLDNANLGKQKPGYVLRCKETHYSGTV